MLKERLNEICGIVDDRLKELLSSRVPELLWDSMAYSVYAGGKRVRPALHIMAARLLDEDIRQNLDIACAIEMIHTYSLIHDDLPALDNDKLRRGKPTNHVVFGEAQAILAGDGLLSYAFEVMLNNAARNEDNIYNHMLAMREVAHAAGVFGMVAGQVQDVAMEGRSISEEELKYIHAHKTGDMITGALLSGIMIHSPSEEQCDALRVYGEKIGLVFQIVDDVLDVTAGEELGKTVGKDARDGKTTYASLYGVNGAMKLAEEQNILAKQALSIFGDSAGELCDFADYMLNRKK